LEELGNKAKEKAIKELEEIKQIAKEDGIDDFRASDISFYSEKLKKAQYDIDEEYYRPYFEQNSVLNGFFTALNELFNIEFKSSNAPSWDEKVKVYDFLKTIKQ
jgi:oligopeptidase A